MSLRALLSLVLFASLSGHTLADSNEFKPSLFVAQAAYNKLLVERGRPDLQQEIEKVEVCFPALGRPKDIWVCSLKLASEDGAMVPMTFRKLTNVWVIEFQDDEAACPDYRIAQKFLREREGNSRLQVTQEVDDGMGVVTRLRHNKSKGHFPPRLMCRYTSERNNLHIVYVGFENGEYTFE